MKRPRKPGAKAPLLPAELRERAARKLRASYEAFITGTAEEEPKQFVTRSAAAREALEHLAQLQEVAGEADAEPSEEAVLAEARAQIARENKS